VFDKKIDMESQIGENIISVCKIGFRAVASNLAVVLFVLLLFIVVGYKSDADYYICYDPWKGCFQIIPFSSVKNGSVLYITGRKT